MSAATTSVQPVSRLDEVVLPGATPERILTGFEFVEGPAWDTRSNSLIFSDIIGDTLYRWREYTELTVLRKPSHMANGNTWDRQGRLLSCEHATSRISRSTGEDEYEVLASHYQGRELNSPNDIVVAQNGRIYFTDPNSGRSQKYGVERPQALEFQGVFLLDPESSELTLLIDDFDKPNGLCFSLDESQLYINDTDKQHIRIFDVLDDGRIANGRIFAETGGDKPGVADGMKVDALGNLYCCGSGGIHVFQSDGARIDVIEVPEVAANFTWGGQQLTDMYITATHSIYRLPMKVSGIQE
jgi:gluconolactonase